MFRKYFFGIFNRSEKFEIDITIVSKKIIKIEKQVRKSSL